MCREFLVFMIYLFGSGSFRDDRKIVKLGYTGNQEEREEAYLLHNPLGKFIGWREGDRNLELKLQLRLEDYKAEILDEWFYWEEGIEEIFCMEEDTLDEWLWENRTRLFMPVPKDGRKRSIYDHLKKKYGEPELEEERLFTL